MKEFSYAYDPEHTRIEAVECGEAYEGIPESLVIEDKFTYIQPWSGYDPSCTLPDQDHARFFPAQTANIKADDRYEGIEVTSNRWIELACEEARLSVSAQGGPFGAVLLQIDDETREVIRYWKNHNHVTLWNDPTAHAEIMVIRSACRQLGVFSLGIIHKDEAKLPQKGKTSHCEIYSSTEPCPMCFAAICWANIPTLVFAATRYDASQQGVSFSDEDIYNAMNKAYKDQKMTVRQATTANSLDAFNLWKRSEKISY